MGRLLEFCKIVKAYSDIDVTTRVMELGRFVVCSVLSVFFAVDETSDLASWTYFLQRGTCVPTTRWQIKVLIYQYAMHYCTANLFNLLYTGTSQSQFKPVSIHTGEGTSYSTGQLQYRVVRWVLPGMS